MLGVLDYRRRCDSTEVRRRAANPGCVYRDQAKSWLADLAGVAKQRLTAKLRHPDVASRVATGPPAGCRRKYSSGLQLGCMPDLGMRTVGAVGKGW